MSTYNGLAASVPALPAAWYFDPVEHAREMATLWRNNWLYVARSEALAAPGTFYTLLIGDQNYLVVRGRGGSLRGFHNTCRHRGSLLCEAHEGQLGTSGRIVCPYHQWAYDTEDGALLQTSSFAEPGEFDKSQHGLFQIAVAEWRGCVFLHPDPGTIWDVDNLFQRPTDNFARFPLESMQIGHTWRTEMTCNWKTFWENFNECLHCPAVHPELTDLVPLYARRIIDPRDVPNWVDHVQSDDPRYRGGLRNGAETWSVDASAQGRVIPSLTAEDLARGHTYASTWPSVFIAGYADHVRIVSLRPLAPERTELIAEWLFTPEALRDPDYDLNNVVDFARLVIEQDVKACELNQRGLHAAPLEAGVLMPEEYLLKRFHDWVRAGLDA
jgi:Rieske 2Fe-2S family protein